MASKLAQSAKLRQISAQVDGLADVLRSARAGREFAASLGFSPGHCDEIELVVTEMASNLVRHAAGGKIYLRALSIGERLGLEVESRDKGPGIVSVKQAMVDGYSTAGGLGNGLGTVNRLMEDLEISPLSPGGLRVVCRRWLPVSSAGSDAGALAFGVATRSFQMLPSNGDSFVFRQWDGQALVGVIDGLGHGEFAETAAQTARQFIEQNCERPLDDLFNGTGHACRATRGVVLALARFDFTKQRLMLAGLGNIEVRLLGAAGAFEPQLRRGIVGLGTTQPVVTEHPWISSSLLIMHSDGLRSDWDAGTFQADFSRPPTVIAQRMLAHLGRIDDDATVIVVKGTA